MGVVSELLHTGAQVHGNATAMVDGSQAPLTYVELTRLIKNASQRLAHFGVAATSRVAIHSRASPETATLTLSVIDHAVCVPLNPAYTQRECTTILKRSRASHVLIGENEGTALRRAAESLRLPIINVRAVGEQVGTFELLGEPGPALDQAADPTCLLLATSGSTAEPKLVLLSKDNLKASTRNLVSSLALTEEDQALHAMPLFHIGAIVDLLLGPLSVGGTVRIHPQVDANAVWKTMTRETITWFQGVPTMLQEVLLAARRDKSSPVPSLRLIRSVSSKLPVGLARDLKAEFKVPIIEIYGMTETAGVITSNLLPPAAAREGSVGRVVSIAPELELRVLDDKGSSVSCGTEGDIEVRGASVMAGYDGQEHELLDGWLSTGDRGYLDSDGYLFLTGRSKEIINRGGEKIAPLEIDEVASAALPGAQVAAFALPHPTLGEEVALAVVPVGGDFDEGRLRKHLEKELAPHKVPRRIFRRSEMVTTPSGKIKRGALADAVRKAGDESTIPEQAQEMSGAVLAMIQIWKSVLDQTSMLPSDNFFDRGGDSLKVATLVTQLKEQAGIELAGFAVMDHPTPEALVSFIETSQQDARLVPQAKTPLKRRVYADLYNVMASWPGEAPHPTSLLRGLNTLGKNPPLFWCGQGGGEQIYLAAYLGSHIPVYGMRSLHHMKRRSEKNLRALGQHLAEEILALQPQGPYHLGGACLGGKVAFHAAEHLRALGHAVDKLFLHEHVEPSFYEGDVCVSFTRANRYTPYHAYLDAPRGWQRYFTGNLDMIQLDCDHGKYFRTPAFKRLCLRIKDHLENKPLSYAPLPTPYQGAPRSAEDCQAEISFTVPRVLVQNQKFKLKVTVTNTSDRVFEVTETSGLFLGSRWLRLNGSLVVVLDASAKLEQPLDAGESRVFTLECRAPDRTGQTFLGVDMVDDGVRWFHKRSNKEITQRSINILPSPTRLFKKFIE